jgi:hypothetical protein
MIFLLLLLVLSAMAIDPWELPIVPSDYDTLFSKETSIPKHLYVSTRQDGHNVSLESSYIQWMFKSAEMSSWQTHLATRADWRTFMKTYYHDTSILWAFEAINEQLPVSQCDIWRVALLYAFGGVYVDDDSFIGIKLDNIIQPSDRLILSTEKNKLGSCFHQSYKLSEHALHERYAPWVWEQMNDTVYTTWAMFAAPRHELLREVMQTMVDTISAEYKRLPIVQYPRAEVKKARFRMVICHTGPVVLTSVLRAFILKSIQNNNTAAIERAFRVVAPDWKEYKGIFKTDFTRFYRNGHYAKTLMKDPTMKMLKEYFPFAPRVYDGHAICDGGRAIYVVQDGRKRLVPNMDTLRFMNYQEGDVIVMRNQTEFDAIPMGEPLKACINC